MKTLQQIIKEMEDDFARGDEYSKRNDIGYTSRVSSASEASILAKYIPKLKLLLNEQPEAITGGSQFCKHDVGGSTASEETTSLVKDHGDTPSETAIVGGNKHIQKSCDTCKHLNTWYYDEPCNSCLADFGNWESQGG